MLLLLAMNNLLLQETNRFLQCGRCGQRDYRRKEISHVNDVDKIVEYELHCQNPHCRHTTKSKLCAMEAEVLFEE